MQIKSPKCFWRTSTYCTKVYFASVMFLVAESNLLNCIFLSSFFIVWWFVQLDKEDTSFYISLFQFLGNYILRTTEKWFSLQDSMKCKQTASAAGSRNKLLWKPELDSSFCHEHLFTVDKLRTEYTWNVLLEAPIYGQQFQRYWDADVIYREVLVNKYINFM